MKSTFLNKAMLNIYTEYEKMQEEKPINNYSIWNTKIGFSEVIDVINNFFSSDLSVFEVGSGNGKFAYYYNKLENNKIVCIDPEPLSYNKGRLYLKPKYSYVTELIKEQPYVVGNCQLLIIWSTPSDDYDMEAIKLLKPQKMIVLYDESGTAGGSDFHDYISDGCDKEYIEKKVCCKTHYVAFSNNYYTLSTFKKI